VSPNVRLVGPSLGTARSGWLRVTDELLPAGRRAAVRPHLRFAWRASDWIAAGRCVSRDEHARPPGCPHRTARCRGC